jgi:antitoxin (DNA-binding transcriptional repressor) of toxin-antitoxin stability system
MDKNEWNVGEAKQQFSELLRRSERQPQLIYRRNRLIAAVVAMDETKASALNEPITLADRFDEIREVFRQEKTQLRAPRRRDRKNDFVSVLDELADGHKRSQ